MSSPDPRPGAACTICGGERFGPGPVGRLSSTGKLPACQSCGSLERHRALRAVLDALPLGLFYRANALVFSRDPSFEPNWFHSFERSIYGEDNSLDLQAVDRPDGLYDVVSLNHVLEFVPDARKAFRELARICSPAGFVQIGLSGPDTRPDCLDYDEPQGVQGYFHLFGANLPAYLGLADLGVRCLVRSGLDDVTGVSEPFHFFSKSSQTLALLDTVIGSNAIGDR